MAKRLNFTKDALLKISPPSIGRDVYHDSKVVQLSLRVTSNGVKTFSTLQWVAGSAGKATRVTIGKFPEVSIEQARKQVLQLTAKIKTGHDPAEDARRARAEMTFHELFHRYVEEHAKLRKRTWKRDVELFDRYLCSNDRGLDLASRKLSSISRAVLATLHTAIGKTHQVSANRTLALVSSAFTKATEWGLWDGANPARGIARFSEQSRDRYLVHDELPRFFASVLSEPSVILRDFYLLLLLTGARKGNLQAMRFSDIDTHLCVWKVAADSSKNKSSLSIVLSEEAMAILDNRLQHRTSQFVFPGGGRTGHLAEPRKGWDRWIDRDEASQLQQLLAKNGTPLLVADGESLSTVLKRARTQADALKLDRSSTRLPNLRPHDLRRTLASWQAINGTAVPILMQFLGHKSYASTQIYARLSDAPVRKSVREATALMLKLAGLQDRSSDEDVHQC